MDHSPLPTLPNNTPLTPANPPHAPLWHLKHHSAHLNLDAPFRARTHTHRLNPEIAFVGILISAKAVLSIGILCGAEMLSLF
jgi:hypothetical protein